MPVRSAWTMNLLCEGSSRKRTAAPAPDVATVWPAAATVNINDVIRRIIPSFMTAQMPTYTFGFLDLRFEVVLHDHFLRDRLLTFLVNRGSKLDVLGGGHRCFVKFLWHDAANADNLQFSL